MIEMTLSSRHRIRNSSPGGLRPSTLPLGHGGSPQYWLSHVDGEETFLFLSNRRDREPSSSSSSSSDRLRHFFINRPKNVKIIFSAIFLPYRPLRFMPSGPKITFTSLAVNHVSMATVRCRTRQNTALRFLGENCTRIWNMAFYFLGK